MAKNLNKAMGTFQDMDNNFFNIMDPEKNSMQEPKPNALYAATRSFVIDSGASYHLIGYNQLTEKKVPSAQSKNRSKFRAPMASSSWTKRCTFSFLF